MIKLPNIGIWSNFSPCEPGVTKAVNENFFKLDVLTQASFIDFVATIGDLPEDPLIGDSYILSSNGFIYSWDGNSWIVTQPDEGWIVYVKDEESYYSFNGTSWIKIALSEIIAPPAANQRLASNNSADVQWVPEMLVRGFSSRNLNDDDFQIPINESIIYAVKTTTNNNGIILPDYMEFFGRIVCVIKSSANTNFTPIPIKTSASIGDTIRTLWTNNEKVWFKATGGGWVEHNSYTYFRGPITTSCSWDSAATISTFMTRRNDKISLQGEISLTGTPPNSALILGVPFGWTSNTSFYADQLIKSRLKITTASRNFVGEVEIEASSPQLLYFKYDAVNGSTIESTQVTDTAPVSFVAGNSFVFETPEILIAELGR